MTIGSISRERWRALEPLLDAALDLEPEQRAAFVDRACEHDPALRDQLRELLAACDRAETFLAEPAVEAFGQLLTETTALPPIVGERYHIVREIARGGMATVYLADEPKHGRQVAIKVLHSGIARLIGRERFEREIAIVAKLSHPHILTLHDSGEIRGGAPGDAPTLYYVTPYVPGESLRDRLQRTPRLTLSEVLRLGREIALALDYAHREGVVHLDVKPENILLLDGHAVVADFGIARATSSAASDGEPRNAVLGTPAYMSPEHALGSDAVDGRSDVYSLGCVLYEMVTGKRAAESLSLATRMEHGSARRRPDRGPLAGRVPPAVASVIMRAMSPARSDRFETAGALAAALGSLADGRRRLPWRRAGMAASAFAVAATTMAPWARNPATQLDPNAVAVAPFDVQSPALRTWKEGMVDVLSRDLDGAGPLHAVAAGVAVHGWHRTEHADAASARAFGLRTHAGLVLYGGLSLAGDSLRANAVLMNTATGRVVAEFEQRDAADRLDRVCDSLTVSVLRELGRVRHIDMARATASPTTSVPALKAYLQGEQFYRAALWDSARVHFERALAFDTTFALAYHRLATVRGWQEPDADHDTGILELQYRANRFPRGLGPRERLLAAADSIEADAVRAWLRRPREPRAIDDERAAVRRLVALLTEGTRRYPDDPEMFFFLGEVRWRFDGIGGAPRDDRAIRALFDRTIALDSSFTPAYSAPMYFAAYLGGADSALRYARAFLSVAPDDPGAGSMKFFQSLLDPTRAAALELDRVVDSLPDETVCEAAGLLRRSSDPGEIVVRLAHALERREERNPARGIPTCAVGMLAEGLRFRGHADDAMRIAALDPAARMPPAPRATALASQARATRDQSTGISTSAPGRPARNRSTSGSPMKNSVETNTKT